METVSMSSAVFVRKVKAHLKTLQAERVVALAKYDADFAKWKSALNIWIKANAVARVSAITKGELQRSSRYSSSAHFDNGVFFRGSPTPPVHPDDSLIKACQAALRQISVTDQKTVRVGPDQIKKLFGEGDGE